MREDIAGPLQIFPVQFIIPRQGSGTGGMLIEGVIPPFPSGGPYFDNDTACIPPSTDPICFPVNITSSVVNTTFDIDTTGYKQYYLRIVAVNNPGGSFSPISTTATLTINVTEVNDQPLLKTYNVSNKPNNEI